MSPFTSCWPNMGADHTGHQEDGQFAAARRRTRSHAPERREDAPDLTLLTGAYYGRSPVAREGVLRMRINIFPTGMRLHEWIAFEEGFFAEQGLEPEVMMDVYVGQMQGWQGGESGYKLRPQDQPFVAGTQAIGNACAWGSVCNAGAGMGKF